MRSIALVLLPLVAACSSPAFVARRTVELDLPLDAATALHCTSHNGGIRVANGQDPATVHVRADLQVRGRTQNEADDHLTRMIVRHEREGATLRVFGEHPSELSRGFSPTYAFDITVPEACSLQLVTHNGGVHTTGTRGALSIETHNGSVDAEVAQPGFSIETHNGRVAVAIVHGGPLGGRVLTHNGSVEVSLPAGACGWIDASTQNGSIQGPAGVVDDDTRRGRLHARIGEADGGTLQLETHNGSVRIR